MNCAWKNITKTLNLKYQVRCGLKTLNYLVDHFLCQIFKIILIILSKNQTVADNPPVRIYVNKLEKNITFRIAKSKKTKDENDENVLQLEITEVVLVHCDVVNDLFGQLLDISIKKFRFSKNL